MQTTIADQKGTHLLITRAGRFAIVERRNNRLYSCHAGNRDGIAADDLAAVTEILDDTDWLDEAAARQAFNEAVSRGTDLAEHMR